MAFFGSHVEYGLHTLVWLALQPQSHPSSRELAELQRIPAAFLAKILAKFEKAGLVEANEGVRGGYGLAKAASAITVLQAIDALDGRRPLFDCQDIRKRCALWEGGDSPFPIGPVCGIHAAIVRAERAMRSELGKTTIADLSQGAYARAPAEFRIDVRNWLARRREERDGRHRGQRRQESDHARCELIGRSREDLPMRIFLAGASGVIGRELIPRLLGRGHSVVGTTRSAEKAGLLRSLGASPVVVDAFDRHGVFAALAAAAPDVLVHQLTDLPDGLEPSRMPSHLPLNARIRKEGTRNLLDAAVAARCPRVVAQSIAWTYAPGPEPHREEDPLALGAEGLLGVTVEGAAALEDAVLHTPFIQGVVLRYGAFYGEGTGAAGPHAGLPSLSLSDAADATVLAVERPLSGIFNIAEPNRWISVEKAATQLGWRAR